MANFTGKVNEGGHDSGDGRRKSSLRFQVFRRGPLATSVKSDRKRNFGVW